MAQHEDPPTVLVVDDEDVLRFLAADVLEEHGYRVIEAADAVSALIILQQRPGVRVLFTDVNMPGGFDGMDLAREVHKRWPEVRLLVTSGRAHLRDDEIPDDGRFVPKPYTPDSLIDAVGDVVRAKHGKP